MFWGFEQEEERYKLEFFVPNRAMCLTDTLDRSTKGKLFQQILKEINLDRFNNFWTQLRYMFIISSVSWRYPIPSNPIHPLIAYARELESENTTHVGARPCPLDVLLIFFVEILIVLYKQTLITLTVIRNNREGDLLDVC